MKNNLLIYLWLFLLLIGQLEAQEGGTIENDCTNGTHTNWDPQYVSPNANNYKKNTFDWTQNGWSVRRFDASGVYGTYPMTSPFYATGIYGPFRNSQFSDFKPEDGWELIKQDLGYFYSAGTWDGGRMGNGQPGMPSDPGDPRLDGTKVSYIVLYNKYSSLLRVFAYLPNGCGSSAYNTIYVKLNLLNPNNYQFNPIGAAPSPYNMNYAPQVNGIFNVYNQGSIMQALDKQTNVSSISAPAKFGYCNAAEMFFADFQLAYDPCICTLQSGIEIEFYSNLSANFKANGQFAGTVGPSNTYNIASIANGQGSVYGNGSAAGEDFIASVFENGGSPKSMIQTYNDLLQVYNDKQIDLAQKAQMAAYIDLFAKGLSFASGLPIKSLKSTLVSALGYSLTYKQALEYGSKGLNYLSANVKEGSAGSEPNLSIASGYMNLNGTITYPPTTYNGNNILIATPGSKDADIMPEYSKGISSTLPNYPMYNEPTGLFTLLNTPKINTFNERKVSSTSSQITPPTPPGFFHKVEKFFDVNYRFNYSFPANFNPQYKLNPIVDETKSNIYIGLEVDGIGAQSIYTTAVIEPEYPYGERWDCFTNEIELHEAFEDKNINMTNFLTDQSNVDSYSTRFFPIQCSSNFLAEKFVQKKVTLTQFVAEIPDYNECVSYNAPMLNHNLLDTLNSYPVGSVRLVVLLDLTSKPDAYGKVHKMFQIQKYNCDVNNVNTDPLASAPLNSYFQAFQNANNNLIQGPYSFSGALPINEIFSYGNITVNGNQYNPWGGSHNALLTAENEISVQGEVKISTAGDDLILRTKSLPSIYDGCSAQSLSQVDHSFLSSYCANSEQYKAKELTSESQGRLIAESETRKEEEAKSLANSHVSDKNKLSMQDNNHTINNLDQNYSINVFPNPTTNKVNLNFFANESDKLSILIEDLMGKKLIAENYSPEKGYSKYTLDLSDFANGIYLLKILNNTGKLISSEKIILNK